MKKIIITLSVGFIILALIFAGWIFFGPTVKTTEDGYLYIRTGTNYDQLKAQLIREEILSSIYFFNVVAQKAGLDNNIKPGKYKLEEGLSIVDLARKLKRGRQEAVRFVITKLRTRADLAGKIGKGFEVDSLKVATFINSNDSLKKYGVDTATLFTLLIPNTYEIYWTESPAKIISRMKEESNKFWTAKRKMLLDKKGLTEKQAYIIASIVEEETNSKKDRPLIASVYLNRLNKGMRLEADPTVKFAMQNFGLKRILYSHLKYASPYNTYLNVGLPPGPISTPTIAAIDAVLNAPATNYIFFVAAPALDGSSVFADNYEDHKINAKNYQKALDAYLLRKQQGAG